MIVVAAAVLSIVLIVPPHKKIHLGLDLRGGLHLMLEVQVDKAIEQILGHTAEAVRKAFRDRGLHVTAVELNGLRGLRMVFSQPPDLRVVEEVTRHYIANNIRQQSPEVLVVDLPDTELHQIQTNVVTQGLEKLRNRIDAFGVSEASISRQGADRIMVQLPGIDDPQRAIELIGRTAQLTFKLVRSHAPELEASLPAGTERLFEKTKDPYTKKLVRSTAYVVDKRALLTGDMVADARSVMDRQAFGQHYVLIRFNARGKRLFAQVTQEHVGQALAIVLDNTVFSAPVIQEPILHGEARITGHFTPEEAHDLAIVLREGALPAPVRIVEHRTIGPSLGSDSIAQGVRSAVLGGALVVLFMLAYYRLSGLIADIALGLNLLILLGALALPALGAALTLPGIAGIVLTLGMAVDANVLIFERIREELRSGKSVQAAVNTGFDRAFSSILDANVTTLIAAVVLFQFGTGPVKGFAVTLSIGLLASMFTAIFVSRTIYETVFSLRRVTRLSI
jgi:preprotein translocase subunit SecD